MSVPLDHAPAQGDKIAVPAWNKLIWFGLLLVVMYFPILTVMVKEWAQDDSMGHGFFVIPVAGYLLWQRRAEILAAPVEGHWAGWVFLVWGYVQLIAGWFGADFFLMRVAFLLSLLGLIVALAGWQVVKVMAFPLFLLLFMVRIPLFIYSQITFPLQLLASSIAANVLTVLGIPVYQDGNILELASQKLSVVEACSGIRSLLSLSFLSLVYGYFFDEKPWMRWALLVASVPIAIGSNAARVSMTGIISTYKREWGEGVYHSLEGWVLFMVALAILIGTHQAVNLIWGLFHRRRGGHA